MSEAEKEMERQADELDAAGEESSRARTQLEESEETNNTNANNDPSSE